MKSAVGRSGRVETLQVFESDGSGGEARGAMGRWSAVLEVVNMEWIDRYPRK